ncbi:nucleoside phosphatase family-domain-containing protein [Chlamydoabsidia padenii]|nr:nucleoside phosphatase family-domain-containing protein [Chlamydoabsidia padenii]
MGGASAQIAFEPDHHQKEEHVADLTKIHLRTLDGSAVDYDVFVTTFLGYGSNEARRRYLEQRVKAAFEQHQQDNDNESSTLLDEHHRLHLDDPCLPLHLELTDADTTSVPLQLTGTGQFNKCLEATLPLLNKDAECPTQPCLFNGVHTPKIDWSVHQFVGISEYWYTSHDVLGLGGVYDFTQYEEKATAFCEKDWALELQDHPDWDAIEIQRYQLQCFKSAWMVNVLHGGIEVPRTVDGQQQQQHDTTEMTTTATTQWMEQSIESVEDKNWNPPFRSIDTINDIQVSWTLGAMLLHVANQIPLSEDGIQGHSSDDEQPHPIADGVELPSSDPHHIATLPDDHSTLDDGTMSWWDLGNTVSVIALLAILMVLFGVVIWEWYRYAKKRKRGGDYRRVDTNGGILGNVASSPPITSSSWSEFLAGPIMVMKQVTVRPMVVLRYWTLRLVSYCGNTTAAAASSNSNNNNMNGEDGSIADDTTYHVGMSGNITELDQDSLSIPMYQQQQQQLPHQQQYPPLAPSSSQAALLLQASSNNGNLGPSTKSSSTISMKYWHKKRYSGDSHHIAQLIQPNHRSNSSSSLVRASTPTSDMTRSRSRIGFAIHETSEEDDYWTGDDRVARTPSPSIKQRSAAPSPKPSPRNSLDLV